ncbi:MAG: hypothetical protein JWM30_1543, partial [Burkholderia sp.]|nr:hypothetical protein [Burkholderia sp.]
SRVLTLEGGLLSRPVAEVTGIGAATVLSLRTVDSIKEPAINLTVEIGCTSSVKRDYQLLLDPVPPALPMASAVPIALAERPERAQRKTTPPAGSMTPQASVDAAASTSAPTAPNPPAAMVRKPAPPPKPKPAAETKSVLTLAGGDAEIEQVRARIALRSATVLSEPRTETDPAKLAASRADQARVAALLRGEDPLAGTQAQLRDAQGKLVASQKAAASAARQHELEKAALAAAQDDMVSGKLVALLGALLLACVAIIGWLMWRRADDRRRQEQAFFAMTAEQDTPQAAPLQQHEQPVAEDKSAPLFSEPAAPAAAASPEVDAMDFTAPADDFAPAPSSSLPHQSYEWRAEAVTPMVSSTPPESLDLPESWLTLDPQAENSSEQSLQFVNPPSILPAADNSTQAHAAEVAGMLLAAESWMAEHNPLRAAEVLRPYLDRDDMQSPAPGLYLLSLYRTMDDKGQIATVAAQLQQVFPAEVAAWASNTQARRSMADFPAVHAVVDSLSDTDKLLPYLNSLLLAPEQFDFSTYRDIVRAIGLANEMKQESDVKSMSLDFQ